MKNDIIFTFQGKAKTLEKFRVESAKLGVPMSVVSRLLIDLFLEKGEVYEIIKLKAKELKVKEFK